MSQREQSLRGDRGANSNLHIKVVDKLQGLDRTFTTEGIAYELGQHGLLDFEEGTHYASAGNGCTTQTANGGGGGGGRRAPRGLSDDEDDEDDDGDISD